MDSCICSRGMWLIWVWPLLGVMPFTRTQGISTKRHMLPVLVSSVCMQQWSSSSSSTHQGHRRAGWSPVKAVRMGRSSLCSCSALGSQPATVKVNCWDVVTASRCHEHLIFNSSQGLFSTIPSCSPRGRLLAPVSGAHIFWLHAWPWGIREKGPQPALAGAVRKPPGPAFKDGTHKVLWRLELHPCSAGSVCITSPGASLLWAFFSKSILSFFFKEASTTKRCFFSSWAIKTVDSMSTLSNACPWEARAVRKELLGLPVRKQNCLKYQNTPHYRHRSMQLFHLAYRSPLLPTQVIPLLKNVVLGKKGIMGIAL